MLIDFFSYISFNGIFLVQEETCQGRTHVHRVNTGQKGGFVEPGAQLRSFLRGLIADNYAVTAIGRAVFAGNMDQSRHQVLSFLFLSLQLTFPLRMSALLEYGALQRAHFSLVRAAPVSKSVAHLLISRQLYNQRKARRKSDFILYLY